MLMTRDFVMQELSTYASPKSKLTRMIKDGEIIHVCRGVFCTENDEPVLPAASMIMEKSYLSFETALAFYKIQKDFPGTIMSAGFGIAQNRYFDTPLGRYEFLYLPKKVFDKAVTEEREAGYHFPIATAEKAVCDTFYKYPSHRTIEAIDTLIDDTLHLDRQRLSYLDWELISHLIPLYHSSTLSTLLAWSKEKAW